MKSSSMDKINAIFKGAFYEAECILKNEIIIPFCDNYSINFISGMGTFYFENKTGKNINCYPTHKTKFYSLLNTVVDSIQDVDRVTKFLGPGFIYRHGKALGAHIKRTTIDEKGI